MRLKAPAPPRPAVQPQPPARNQARHSFTGCGVGITQLKQRQITALGFLQQGLAQGMATARFKTISKNASKPRSMSFGALTQGM